MILSQSPVRKDQFTVFVHQYINSASTPIQPIWPIYGIPLKGVGINEVAMCFPKIRFVSFFNMHYLEASPRKLYLSMFA